MKPLMLLAAAMQMALDWAALPPLPWRAPPVVTPQMSGFVAREVRERRCPVATPAKTLVVDVAVLVDADGAVRVAVPRAIQCPTVEQYAAGIVSSFAHNNLLPGVGTTDQWYRTSLSFTLGQ